MPQTESSREAAQRLLLDHYRFRWTLSAEQLKECREESPWWLRSVETVLPLVFGCRSSRADRMRRRASRVRDRLQRFVVTF
jgi:hypothetical protein